MQKFENAKKYMEKRGTPFRVDSFFVEKTMILFLFRLCAVVAAAVIQNVCSEVRYLVYKAWENVWLNVIIVEIRQLVTFSTPHTYIYYTTRITHTLPISASTWEMLKKLLTFRRLFAAMVFAKYTFLSTGNWQCDNLHRLIRNH